MYAWTIEAYTGFFVEVAARAPAIVSQRHVPRVARLHDAARIFSRQAVAGQDHIHHGGGHIARVLEDEAVLLQALVRRDAAEVVQGVHEGDLCPLRAAGLVGLVAVGAGGCGKKK